MPLKWIEPELFLLHNDVPIYRTYRHDSPDDPYIFHFSTSTDDGDVGRFDVRELPREPHENTAFTEEQKTIIRRAIEAGYFADFPIDDPPPQDVVSNSMTLSFVVDDIMEEIGVLWRTRGGGDLHGSTLTQLREHIHTILMNDKR